MSKGVRIYLSACKVGLETTNVERGMLCVRILGQLCSSILVEVFEALKPLLWNVVLKFTDSDELGKLSVDCGVSG